ncbi:hypothetical protein [Campylobacter volucris]|nr:hypothetical protein [Campylobacter volucris]
MIKTLKVHLNNILIFLLKAIALTENVSFERYSIGIIKNQNYG